MKNKMLQNSFYALGRIITYFTVWLLCLILFITIFENLISKKLGTSDIGIATEVFFSELVAFFSIIVANFIIKRYTAIGTLNIFNINPKLIILSISVSMIWILTSILGQLATSTLYYKFGFSEVKISTIFIFASALFLNTIFQELLVRGYLYKILSEKFSPFITIFVSSIVFLLFHGAAIAAGFIPALNVFGASIVLGILFYKTNSIWVPIIVHFAWNFVFVLIGLTSIGTYYPSFNFLTLYGSDLLAGGKIGIEGTISTTIVMLITIFALAKYLKRSDKN